MKVGDNGKWVNDDSWPKSRTLRSYQQDLANLLAEEEDETGRTRVSGRDYHSIARKPIIPLPFDILQIVPPSLHIILGLVVRFFKHIEEKCKQLDQGTAQDHDVHDVQDVEDEQWQADSEAAKGAELYMREAREVLDEETLILNQLIQAKRGRSTNGLTTDACCMPLCKLAISKPEEVNINDVSWIRCMTCGEGQTKGWFHTYCVGISGTEYENTEYRYITLIVQCAGKKYPAHRTSSRHKRRR